MELKTVDQWAPQGREDLIQFIKSKIDYPYVDVYLAGSIVFGTFTEGSDIDVVVKVEDVNVLPNKNRERYEYQGHLVGITKENAADQTHLAWSYENLCLSLYSIGSGQHIQGNPYHEEYRRKRKAIIPKGIINMKERAELAENNLTSLTTYLLSIGIQPDSTQI